MDVEGHGDKNEAVIKPIRDWLYNDVKIVGSQASIPASILRKHFGKFETDFPTITRDIGYDPDEPEYGDILKIVAKWLEDNPVQVPASGA